MRTVSWQFHIMGEYTLFSRGKVCHQLAGLHHLVWSYLLWSISSKGLSYPAPLALYKVEYIIRGHFKDPLAKHNEKVPLWFVFSPFL